MPVLFTSSFFISTHDKISPNVNMEVREVSPIKTKGKPNK